MSERENGWYLRSDGYMTSECSYQRIGAMKSDRALDNHQKLIFVKYMGGEEKDSRVYVPHSGTCKLIDTTSPGNDDYWNSAKCSECGAEFTCAIFGRAPNTPDANYCPNCGRKVVG